MDPRTFFLQPALSTHALTLRAHEIRGQRSTSRRFRTRGVPPPELAKEIVVGGVWLLADGKANNRSFPYT
jgi:hypothetical protein